jgi:hypothetical protein
MVRVACGGDLRAARSLRDRNRSTRRTAVPRGSRIDSGHGVPRLPLNVLPTGTVAPRRFFFASVPFVT